MRCPSLHKECDEEDLTVEMAECPHDVCPYVHPVTGYAVLNSNGNVDLWATLVKFCQAKSNSDARRLIEGGGVRRWDGVDWVKVDPRTRAVPPTHHEADFYEVGKKRVQLRVFSE